MTLATAPSGSIKAIFLQNHTFRLPLPQAQNVMMRTTWL